MFVVMRSIIVQVIFYKNQIHENHILYKTIELAVTRFKIFDFLSEFDVNL